MTDRTHGRLATEEACVLCEGKGGYMVGAPKTQIWRTCQRCGGRKVAWSVAAVPAVSVEAAIVIVRDYTLDNWTELHPGWSQVEQALAALASLATPEEEE